MKKFLALVMALCMVCMTVAVASAANSSPAVSVKDANGKSIAVTYPNANENIGLSGDKVTAVKFDGGAKSGELTLVMPAVMSNATLSVYCMVPSGPAAFFDDATQKWVAATNVSLNGTTLTFTAPAGTVAVAVVENAGGSSAGTATAGASGAGVTAPKTNDVPVELILGLGVVMFAGVAVACKRRAA